MEISISPKLDSDNSYPGNVKITFSESSLAGYILITLDNERELTFNKEQLLKILSLL